MKSIVYLVLIGVFAVAQATDYCDKALCGDSKHIGCGNSGNFSSSCPADRKSIAITTEFQNAIVKRHNELRNNLAIGNLTGFQPSTRMATMKWNNELAKLADMNVKTCKFEHDACHNTVEFPYSGQNLAEVGSDHPFTTTAMETALPLIDSWWSEYKSTTMDYINSYPSKAPPKVIGHFTVAAVDKNTQLGCAISSFKVPNGYYTFLFACDYSMTNIVNGKTYTSGKTASQCKTGTNPKYKGLCSENEKY